jgi:hypothetical protein
MLEKSYIIIIVIVSLNFDSDGRVSDGLVSDGLVSDGLVSDRLVSDGLVSDGLLKFINQVLNRVTLKNSTN